jgi:hypothetical protein
MLQDAWCNTITFTPDQLLIGTGWHEVEKEGDFYFRWSGPEQTATIHLTPRRDQGNRVNLTIHAAAAEELLADLRLEADGIPLQGTLGRGRYPVYITAVLPADVNKKKGEETVLALHLPGVLPASQINPGTVRGRLVGVALRRIEIFPLARPLFIAEKYNDPIPFDGIKYIKENPGVRDAVIHGACRSAYEYFLKQRRPRAEDAFELHALFDERPGDLYDIVHAEMREQCKILEEQYVAEIKILREMLYRQGDAIRGMKK